MKSFTILGVYELGLLYPDILPIFTGVAGNSPPDSLVL
jgi:hypothetical protein